MAKKGNNGFLFKKVWERKLLVVFMNKLSAVIIAKDAEERIADCLESVFFCSEVIVVDNESKDRTAEIAKRMGAKVISYKGNDFSKMRNLGLKEAKEDWVLYIDSDEEVTPKLAKNIQSQISNSSNIAAYKINRKNFYLGKSEWPKIEELERLFKKDSFKEWYGQLHESPRFNGKVGKTDGYLLHFTHKDLTSMLNKTIEWSKIEAELRFNANHPKMAWWRFPRVMLTVFFDYYIKQGGWKAGTAGLVESIYQLFSIFITYARLWELQKKDKK